MKTLFLALLLGEERGARLAASVDGVLGPRAGRAFRRPRPAGLHLTLFYLGRIGADAARRVARSVEPAVGEAGRPRLVIEGPGAFPARGRERVLWLGVREEPAAAGRLAGLHGLVLDALEIAGVDTGSERGRPFRAHITVARAVVRARAGAHVPEAFYSLAPRIAWEPDLLHLVESVPASGPPRYVSRAAFSLGA